MELDKTKVINILDRYFKELGYLHASFETFFLMRYGNKEWEKVYEISPVFFNLVINSLLFESLITLCKFVEGYKRETRSVLNLNLFLKKLKNYEKLFTQLSTSELMELHDSFDKYKNVIDSFKETIDKLLTVRDKVIAHYDDVVISEIFENARISAEEIRDLIDKISEILNFYYYKVERGKIISYKFIDYDDVNRLMEFVLKRKNNKY